MIENPTLLEEVLKALRKTRFEKVPYGPSNTRIYQGEADDWKFLVNSCFVDGEKKYFATAEKLTTPIHSSEVILAKPPKPVKVCFQLPPEHAEAAVRQAEKQVMS